jgi:phage-related protein
VVATYLLSPGYFADKVRHASLAAGAAAVAPVLGVWNTIKSVTSTVWTGIRDSLTGVWNVIKSTASTVLNGIKSVIRDAWDWIVDKFNKTKDFFVHTVPGWFSSLGGSIKDVFNSIKDWFSDTWPKITDLITTPIRTVVNGVYNHEIAPIWNATVKSSAART